MPSPSAKSILVLPRPCLQSFPQSRSELPSLLNCAARRSTSLTRLCAKSHSSVAAKAWDWLAKPWRPVATSPWHQSVRKIKASQGRRSGRRSRSPLFVKLERQTTEPKCSWLAGECRGSEAQACVSSTFGVSRHVRVASALLRSAQICSICFVKGGTGQPLLR